MSPTQHSCNNRQPYYTCPKRERFSTNWQGSKKAVTWQHSNFRLPPVSIPIGTPLIVPTTSLHLPLTKSSPYVTKRNICRRDPHSENIRSSFHAASTEPLLIIYQKSNTGWYISWQWEQQTKCTTKSTFRLRENLTQNPKRSSNGLHGNSGQGNWEVSS